MERPDRSRDKAIQVTPDPKDANLFAFIERLFDGSDQTIERLEVRQAYGHGLRQYGTLLIQKEFKPNAPKPKREQLVSLSNELLDVAQQNCNAIRKSHAYGVLAKHYAKSDDYIACHVLPLSPKRNPTDAYDPMLEEVTDAQRKDALVVQMLDVLKEQNENRRWEQEQFATSIGGLFDRFNGVLTSQAERIQQLEGRYMEFVKISEESLSRKQERDMAADSHRVRMGLLQDGLQFAKQVVPLVINKISNKSTIPTKESAESLALATFLGGLADNQARSLFGDIVEGELKGNGIFTPDQTLVLYGVSRCEVQPSELDRLFGGDLSVSSQQLEQAQQVVSPQQFGPLFALFLERQKSPPPPAPTPNNGAQTALS